MPTPIPKERIAELQQFGICGPALAWLSAGGRCYEDLSEHPEWCFVSAYTHGGDVRLLQEIVIAHGDAALRRKFAQHVRGADRARLLEGL